MTALKLNPIYTPLAKLLKIDVPIILAPMALANTETLASAVSATGAFGFMGAGFLSPSELKQKLTLIRERLSVNAEDPVPIGVGFIGWVLEKTEDAEDPRIRAVLEQKVAAIWLAFGSRLGQYVEQIRAYDAKREHKTVVFTIVNSVEEALRAANKWKVDVVVAQGIESGGHGGSEAPPLLTLLQAVIDALPLHGPLIVAAGGVSTGKQIAALLTMGVSGVVLGTRFLFTDECGYTPEKKDVLLKAGMNSTVRGIAFDEVGRTMGWPPKQDGRAISNNIIEDVEEGLDLDQRLRRFDESASAGDSSRLVVWAGVGVALTSKIAPAADVVRELSAETTVYLIPKAQHGWPAIPRKTFLLAAWMEGILYGFLCCIFGATMYVYFSSTYSRIGSRRDRHTTGMIIISAIMFFIASFHLGMNAFRLLRGYADERLAPGGPVGYLGVLRKWDHILKDTLYATQENLGSAAAIYRCWVLWNFNWKVIVLPTILLFMNIAAGYVVCGTYPSIDPTASIFNPVLLQWIKTFYAIAVVLNVMTTGLMSYRIWMAHKNSASYVVGKGRLLSIIRILIESAALQLVVEIVLLGLYTANLNAQYILLECVTPTVAITFNTITVRIKLQSVASARSKSMQSTDATNPVQTIGSLPMKRIHVNIDRESDNDTQTTYDDKTNAV